MPENWGRFAPLTGVMAAALTLIAALTTNTSPSGSASGTKVLSWYATNSSHQKVGDILFAFAVAFLVFFVASMRSYIRGGYGSDGLATLMLAGSAFAAVGIVIGVGIDYALADYYRHLSPSSAQALNALNESFIPLPGLFVFYIASGAVIIHSRALPVWIGWVGVVLGVASVIPPTAVAGFFALVFWPLVLGILIFIRTGRPVTQASAAAPAPA